MSFTWSPPGRALAPSAPTVRHVLFYFDGPKMVLALDARGRQLLGVAADEDEDALVRWVFAPAPPEKVVTLLRTRAGLRRLFELGPLDVLDLDPSGACVRAWSVLAEDVPEELLPAPDAELPELTADATVQLVNDQTRHIEQRGRLARARLLFRGRPVRGQHGISATFAAAALSGYQDIVSKAYGSRKQGALSATGPIPQRGGSTLVLTDMPRGSVGFELVEDAEQERVVPTDLAEVVRDVGGLLDAAATSDAAYAEAVAEFAPRVAASLATFFSLLKKDDATLRLESQGREFVFDAVRINDALERTALVPREEGDRPVPGRLLGFMPTERRFELETPDGVLKGKIARDADVEVIGSFFRKPCVAHLQVVTVERQGQRADAYTLLRVEEPPSA